MELQQTLTELLQRIGMPSHEAQMHWDDLEKAYRQSNRHYHNLSHLEEMRKSFFEYKSELQFPDETLYSLYYHDVVYISTRKDNEQKSAEWAIALLPEEINLNKQIIFDLILATKDHNTNGVADANWLIDFDLKILAKDWRDYKIYAEQIRKEYSLYPDFLYNPGRVKALKHFLEKPHIYQTTIFQEKFESKARTNIQKEMASLQS